MPLLAGCTLLKGPSPCPQGITVSGRVYSTWELPAMGRLEVWRKHQKLGQTPVKRGEFQTRLATVNRPQELRFVFIPIDTFFRYAYNKKTPITTPYDQRKLQYEMDCFRTERFTLSLDSCQNNIILRLDSCKDVLISSQHLETSNH